MISIPLWSPLQLLLSLLSVSPLYLTPLINVPCSPWWRLCTTRVSWTTQTSGASELVSSSTLSVCRAWQLRNSVWKINQHQLTSCRPFLSRPEEKKTMPVKSTPRSLYAAPPFNIQLIINILGQFPKVEFLRFHLKFSPTPPPVCLLSGWIRRFLQRHSFLGFSPRGGGRGWYAWGCSVCRWGGSHGRRSRPAGCWTGRCFGFVLRCFCFLLFFRRLTEKRHAVLHGSFTKGRLPRGRGLEMIEDLVSTYVTKILSVEQGAILLSIITLSVFRGTSSLETPRLFSGKSLSTAGLGRGNGCPLRSFFLVPVLLPNEFRLKTNRNEPRQSVAIPWRLLRPSYISFPCEANKNNNEWQLFLLLLLVSFPGGMSQVCWPAAGCSRARVPVVGPISSVLAGRSELAAATLRSLVLAPMYVGHTVCRKRTGHSEKLFHCSRRSRYRWHPCWILMLLMLMVVVVMMTMMLIKFMILWR